MRVFTNGDGAGELGARTESPLPAVARGVTLPRAALERLVGQYDGGRLSMRVFLDGDALKAQLGGQPPVDLLATSATQFDVAETEATLEFSAGDALATQATIRQNGREMVMGRQP
jgi:D-alanyl-D-alanine carboxypeptidase